MHVQFVHWKLYCVIQAIELDMKNVDMATKNMIHLLNIFLMSNWNFEI